ncbi:MAG: deoxyhypusine synthase family protein [Atribacterota bacterium]
MKQNKFLKRRRIFPKTPQFKTRDIENLIKYYSASGAYNGGRLAEACAIYEKMINENATICLTIAGALTPTGIGGFINQLIKKGFVDFIISTGANLYHDLHFALDLPVFQGDFRVDDKELVRRKIVRIYDIFIPEETLLKTDKFIQEIIKEYSPETTVSTSNVHNFIGEKLWETAKKPGCSILANAAKYDVPIFTPSPGDSSIGMNMALLKMLKNNIVVDTDLDILESSAIVYNSDKTGAVQLGGGAPKNFYMQTQPMLSQIMDICMEGHDYFIQITADAPHWGGLSGATPSEAVSWKKVNPDEVKNNVVIYCDVTIAAPILFSHILSKNKGRRLKRLYLERDIHLDRLKRAYNK